jgi:hypothetical protein
VQRSALRASSLLLYAAVAALGEALVARPALLFARGLGLLHTVLPWRVPFGALELLLALGIAACALLLGVRVMQEKPRLRWHAALLGLLALSLCVRGAADEPRPPADPLPALMTGLRAAASAVERRFAAARPLDSAAIDGELALLEPPGFVRFGRRLPLRIHAVECGDCGEGEPLDDERARSLAPGTICVLLPRGRRIAWLNVRTLHGFAALPDGRQAVIDVRGATHTVPGRDPLLPAYPAMRLTSDPNAQPP